MDRGASPWVVCSLIAPLAAWVALVAGAPLAEADPGESALSLSLEAHSVSLDEHDALGGGIGAAYEYGITRDLFVRGHLAGVAYAEDGEAAMGTIATVGLTYIVDVLKYVPYLHAGVGGAITFGGPLETDLHPVAELGAGLDRLSGRGLSYGVFVAMASFLDDSLFLSAGARVTWRWGFF